MKVSPDFYLVGIDNLVLAYNIEKVYVPQDRSSL
jgi:hypothetical protein